MFWLDDVSGWVASFQARTSSGFSFSRFDVVFLTSQSLDFIWPCSLRNKSSRPSDADPFTLLPVSDVLGFSGWLLLLISDTTNKFLINSRLLFLYSTCVCVYVFFLSQFAYDLWNFFFLHLFCTYMVTERAHTHTQNSIESQQKFK